MESDTNTIDKPRERMFVYELTHPTDHTLNGQVRTFRDTDQESADIRARRVARDNGCGLKRREVIP